MRRIALSVFLVALLAGCTADAEPDHGPAEETVMGLSETASIVQGAVWDLADRRTGHLIEVRHVLLDGAKVRILTSEGRYDLAGPRAELLVKLTSDPNRGQPSIVEFRLLRAAGRYFYTAPAKKPTGPLIPADEAATAKALDQYGLSVASLRLAPVVSLALREQFGDPAKLIDKRRGRSIYRTHVPASLVIPDLGPYVAQRMAAKGIKAKDISSRVPVQVYIDDDGVMRRVVYEMNPLLAEIAQRTRDQGILAAARTHRFTTTSTLSNQGEEIFIKMPGEPG